MAALPRKVLLRCLRNVAAELRSTSTNNLRCSPAVHWKLNSRGFATEGKETEKKAEETKEVEKVEMEEEFKSEEEMKKEQWARERRKAVKDGRAAYYCAPTTFEKWILVAYGEYPTIKDVPDLVTESHILNIKDKFRGKASIVITIIAGMIAFLIIRYSEIEYKDYWDHEGLKIKPDFDKSKPLMVPAEDLKKMTKD